MAPLPLPHTYFEIFSFLLNWPKVDILQKIKKSQSDYLVFLFCLVKHLRNESGGNTSISNCSGQCLLPGISQSKSAIQFNFNHSWDYIWLGGLSLDSRRIGECRHEILHMRYTDCIWGIINLLTKSTEIATFTGFKIKLQFSTFPYSIFQTYNILYRSL